MHQAISEALTDSPDTRAGRTAGAYPRIPAQSFMMLGSLWRHSAAATLAIQAHIYIVEPIINGGQLTQLLYLA